MKKRKRQRQQNPRASKQTAGARRKRQKRELLKVAIAVLIVVPMIGTALAVFKHNYDITHDLSVIGEGLPTVVQIHDPKCQLCLELRRNASAAIEDMDGSLLFRVADITTPAGRRLQRQHDVPNVTLLLFDGKGELRRVLNGVKSEALLEHTFSRHIERWG